MTHDILFQKDNFIIDCSFNGLEVTLTFSDDPTFHYVRTLCSTNAYEMLKNKINEVYDSCEYPSDDCNEIVELFWTDELDDLFVGDGQTYRDARSREEIDEYLEEACDKVWLMRTRPCDNQGVEKRRLDAINRIFNTYDDIPDEGYTDWECGYWNGILGALRWVLGNEKDFLDT